MKPEGHVDLRQLQQEVIELRAEKGTDVSGRVKELVEQMAAILRPFADVDASNERWRDEAEELAKEIAILATQSEVPLSDLEQGQTGLREYDDVIVSTEVTNEILVDNSSTFPELVDKLNTAIKAFTESCATEDEWQIRHDGDRVHDRSRAIMLSGQLRHVREAHLGTVIRSWLRIPTIVKVALKNENHSPELREYLQFKTQHALERAEELKREQAEHVGA